MRDTYCTSVSDFEVMATRERGDGWEEGERGWQWLVAAKLIDPDERKREGRVHESIGDGFLFERGGGGGFLPVEEWIGVAEWGWWFGSIKVCPFYYLELFKHTI